jgi:glyoxylase-like metal-dependent hydrolase (beta-lactamase superfamily II)
MTGPGTNGYIVGEGTVAVVDPGPDDDRHLAAWLDALAGEEVSHILVTHAHLDHSGLARRLAQSVRATVVGFGRWDMGRSETMQRLAELPGVAGGEGVDRSFDPDLAVSDGETISGPNWRIEVLHIPGHFAGHLGFATDQVALTGDHVLGWTSTIISPPDGDLRQFLASCERLKRAGATSFLPGHGDPIDDPVARLDWLVSHRRERERQILEALSGGEAEIGDLVRRLYTDAPPRLWPAAARNVLAHLIALWQDGRVVVEGNFGTDARYRLNGPKWLDQAGSP